MDCRRRLRLGSALAMVLAAALAGRSETFASQEPSRPPLVFESRPDVDTLRCPSQDSTPSKPAAPKDRLPVADELEAAAIRPSRLVPSVPPPRLSEDVVRRFALPPPGGHPLRIGVWGDSHVAAGFITDELRKLVSARGLTVAARIIPPSAGRPGVRLPVRRVCKGGWQFQPVYNAPGSTAVGPALANLRSTKAGDYLWLDLRHDPDRPARRLVIHYLPAAAASTIGVRIDDGAEVRIEVAQSRGNERVTPGEIELRASSTISTLKLRLLRGEFTLQGVTLDYDAPVGVTIDVFGIPSATVNGWSTADPSYVKESMGADSYDAVILEFGTNEGAVGRFDAAKYAATLTSSLKNLRAVLPDAACLLIGPTDRGVRIPQGPRTGRLDFLKYSRIHQEITRIQGGVGAKFGCAVWDWQRAMGGTGSIYGWARATPALAAPDLIHLTPAGYRRSAEALAQSLGWLAAKPTVE